jgi:PAS domain S-box-containing protein
MAVRDSEQSLDHRAFDAVAEHLPFALIRTDAGAECLYANRRWCRMVGLSPDQTLGPGWVRAVHPEDRERVVRRMRECAGGEDEFADQFRLRSPDGHIRMASSRVVAVRAGGEVTGYLAAVTDLTERQSTEDALRSLARELHNRVNELNCLVGLSQIIERCDASLPDVLEQTAALLADSWEHADVACARIAIGELERRTPDFRETPWRQRSEIQVKGETVGFVEVGYLMRMPERDEGPFLAEERSVLDAVAERLGRTAERIESNRLLREREQEIRARLAHLARINVMGEMATSIAHEVSQPLTAIAAYAQACRRMLAPDEALANELMHPITRIAQEAERAGDIIHRIVDLSRKRRTRSGPCEINALIADIRPLADVDARLHDTVLQFDIDGALPTMFADGVQLQQVVLNLIRNAIDAAGEVPLPRRVRVSTASHEDGFVRVSVCDNGAGVPDEVGDRLFDPFFTTKETGIGMGLSISRSIISRHGGRMWYERNPDGGTTFHFTCPLQGEVDDDDE